HRSGYFSRPILFVGDERDAAELHDLASLPASGFRIAGKLLKGADERQPISAQTLMKSAEQAGACEIVVGSCRPDASVWPGLVQCRLSGLRVVDYLDFCETQGGRICIEAIRPEWLALSDGFRFRRAAELARRLADLMFAL